MLLDRRKVKFWQKIVFGFMAFLMAAFLVVGYSGVLNGCTLFDEEESISDTLNQEIATARRRLPRHRLVTPRSGSRSPRPTRPALGRAWRAPTS